ncbi:unnamed protein product [Blepharisma stoltei]|uniref:Uncharacterized protein n=1 Tax=Blepharisma stoltei TaxID=1481888 RepID=A0AAU9J471_9CILI|nr:unnamed protein product [Blepharisma stoltei]
MYQDEHLAWQQRVQKEITAANRFMQTKDRFSETQRSLKTERSSKHSSHHHSLSPQKQYNPPKQANNLGTVNVYAEVRGKYARMPIPNPNPTKSSVISRPTTQGSLVKYSKRSHGRALSLPPQEEQEAENKRPLAKEENSPKRNLVSRGSATSKISKKAVKVPTVEKSTNEKQDVLIIGENEEKQAEEVITEENEENEQEQDAETEYSFKTTSSQKKYIEELEKLLKEERVKRLKAEELLHSIRT